MTFIPSKFPTRVHLRCVTCHSVATVTGDDYDTAQVFCSVDAVPMTVIGVSVGVPAHMSVDDEPHVAPLLKPRATQPVIDGKIALLAQGYDAVFAGRV